MKKIIAIITGGSSTEREISIWSSQTVIEILQKKFQVEVFDFPKDIDKFVKNRKKFCLAVPIMHGVGGEDGSIQGFLSSLGVPFLFSDILGQAIGMNKALTKIVAQEAGLNIINSCRVKKGQTARISRPSIIKPIDGGSSIGVTRANNQKELTKALAQSFKHCREVLVEDYIVGREFTAGVLQENRRAVALPITEIIPTNGMFDYENKYVSGKMAAEPCPAKLDKALTKKIQQYAVAIHEALGLKHLSRSDFILDSKNKIWFLEVNTIPGMTKNSLWPKSLKVSGRDLEKVFYGWVKDEMK